MSYYQNIELNWNTWKSVETGLATTVYYLQNDLQYVPFVVDTTNTFVYYVNVNRDPSSVSGPYAALAAGAKATATIQDITYTAVNYGVAGNSITIQYVNDATGVGKEYVTVSGNAITVHIVSGSSTAQQVVTAVTGWNAYSGLSQYNSAASSYLVSAMVTGSTGNPQTTQGPTSLSGGINTETVLADWTNNYQSTSTLVGSFSDGIGEEVSA